MKITLVLTLLASSLFLTSCSSDSGRRGGLGNLKSKGDRFAKLDSSGDGQIDFSEFEQSPMAKKVGDAREAFTKLDSNSNGSISKEEMRAGAIGRIPRPAL